MGEAGGLIGNFTGEADFLYQREVVAGNPKVYGQLVQILAPYTRVIGPADEAAAATAGTAGPAGKALDATSAFVQQATAPAASGGEGPGQAPGSGPAPARQAVRIRKNAAPEGEDAPM